MVKEIKLTQGQVALVDDSDYEWLSGYSWFVHNTGKYKYAQGWDGTTRNRKRVVMHRIIIDAQPGEQVDHINHDGLDNRRENLRKCTASQNQGNSRIGKNNVSGYKGVSLFSSAETWRCTIRCKGTNKYLGTFDTPEEAAYAYDMEAARLFGEFAYLNFKDEASACSDS